jgi:hypothetical protein
MKFSRIDLLTLLISLFILNGCKNQDPIGLGVTSANQINGAYVDTSTIVITTLKEDSVATSGLTKTPFGFLNDPLIGTTQIDLATDLNLPGQSSYSLPPGTITIDSARLILSYANGFYGDSIASVFGVNVYQLNQLYRHDTTYFSNRKFSYSQLIGHSRSDEPIRGATHDSVQIFRIISGAPDTLYKVPRKMRIPINPNFINNYLFSLSATTLGNNTLFQNNVRGLYLTIDQTKSTGLGGIFMLSADTLQVYFKAVNGNTIDTSSVALPIASMAAVIKHTYTPAVNSVIGNTTSAGSRNFYLQGPAGLKVKISFPHLLENLRNNLLKKDSDILINRAELVINPVSGTYSNPFTPLPKITMYTLDLAGRPKELQDASTSDPRTQSVAAFGGNLIYNPQYNTNNYHFIITAFLQDLLYQKTKDYGTFIAPADNSNTTSVSIGATAQVAARTIAVGTDNTSAYQIKLNIIYTKILKPNN